MNDFVLVGYLTHIEAFEQFVKQLRDTEFLSAVNPFNHANQDEFRDAIAWSETWNAKWESYADEFIGFLVAGQLEFVAVLPLNNTQVRIMPNDWRGDFWPSRPFMSEAVVCASDSPLIKFNGRTPMIARTTFESWLKMQKQSSKVANLMIQSRWGVNGGDKLCQKAA